MDAGSEPSGATESFQCRLQCCTATRVVTIERYGPTSDHEIRITLNNDACLMSGNRADASIANACNGAPIHNELRIARLNNAAVAGRVTNANNVLHG